MFVLVVIFLYCPSFAVTAAEQKRIRQTRLATLRDFYKHVCGSLWQAAAIETDAEEAEVPRQDAHELLVMLLDAISARRAPASCSPRPE